MLRSLFFPAGKGVRPLGWVMMAGCLLLGQVGFGQATQTPGGGAPPAGRLTFRERAINFYHVFTGDTVSPGRARVTGYPTIAFTPETNFEFGISSLLVFAAKEDYVRNRLSEVTAFGFVTLRRQYGLWMDHAIYTDLDKWFFLGRQRIQEFPLLYFGIGPNAPREGNYVIEASYLLIRQRVMRRLANNLFLGPEVDIQNLWNTRYDATRNDNGDIILPPPKGIEGNFNLGVGAALVYDSRHNYLNVREGYFAELSFLRYTPAVLSEDNFATVLVDARRFVPGIGPGQVWATQLWGQFTAFGDPPFNQLALVGNEMLHRGYYTGRYRDREYVAAQTEYRWLPFRFTKYFGAAVFGAVGSVAPRIGELGVNNAFWTAGGGLRFNLLPRRDIFLRFDVGFQREGPGYYIFLGEAF